MDLDGIQVQRLRLSIVNLRDSCHFMVPRLGLGHFLHWQTRYTNTEGYVRFGRHRYPVNYSVVWEHNGWTIRDGWILQAFYNGPRLKSHWNLEIDGGKSGHYAAIHRASIRSFYGNNLNLPRPSRFRKQKICYIDKKGTGDYWGNVGMGVLPDIRIYGKKNINGQRKDDFNVMATTFHELGHAAHLVYVGKVHFFTTGKAVVESWANAVEWELIKKEYYDLGFPIYDTDEKYDELTNQLIWPNVDKSFPYTPIFLDLIDDLNQRVASNNYSLPNDNVKGYTIFQLSRLLPKIKRMSHLRDEVKKIKPRGVTDSQINDLFSIFLSY